MLLMYNVALNKRSYQSSVHRNDYGAFPARFANDGSRHTTYNTGTKCSVSNYDRNPWWAVDLARPTTVYRVDFTNRDAVGD